MIFCIQFHQRLQKTSKATVHRTESVSNLEDIPNRKSYRRGMNLSPLNFTLKKWRESVVIETSINRLIFVFKFSDPQVEVDLIEHIMESDELNDKYLDIFHNQYIQDTIVKSVRWTVI